MHALPGSEREGDPAAPLALLVALAAALAGALVWAAIAYVTGYEVGYVAWAVGGLVGLATVRAGGRGATCAAAAAALTVLGIVVGKLLGTHLVVGKQLDQACEESFTRAYYQELRTDAELYSALGAEPSEDDVRRFVFERGYTLAESPEAIQGEELVVFHAYNVPELAVLGSSGSFDDWFAERSGEARASFAEEFSLPGAVLEDLNAIDAIFVVLAVSTAFGMIRRAEPQVVPAPPAQDEELGRAA